MNTLQSIFLSFVFVASSVNGNAITVEPRNDSGLYTLKVDGAAVDCPVLLVKEHLSGKITSSPGYVREDGILGKMQEGYPAMELNFGETPPGEAIVLNIISCDRTRSCAKMPEYASCRFIPKPLAVKNEQGVTLSCEIADVKAESFWIRMSGLEPKEVVTFRSTMFGDQKILRESADENGEMEFFFALEKVVSEEETFALTASNARFSLTL